MSSVSRYFFDFVNYSDIQFARFSMIPSLFIARRYARPQRGERFLSFVSLIALGSIALGSAALIIALAVLGGFERDLRENAVKFTSHVQLQGFAKKPLPNYQNTLDILTGQIPNISSASPFIAHEGIARSSSFLDGVLIKGILPQRDVSAIKNNMTKGAFNFSSPNAFEIIVGQKLARKLNVDVGGKMVLYSILGDPTVTPPIVEEFRIVGLYSTGMAEYDDMYVYIPFAVAGRLFEMPEQSASGFDIMVKNIGEIDATVTKIEDTLGYPYYPRSVFEMYSSMFAWIELQRKPIPLVLALISIVAVFNVVATLLMLVVEKMHSIGILRSIGMKRRDILRIFLFQGLTIGVAGTLTGCALAFGVCWLQATYKIIALKGEIYYLDAVPIEFNLTHYAIVISVSLVMCFLATLIPSYIASRIQPLKALHF